MKTGYKDRFPEILLSYIERSGLTRAEVSKRAGLGTNTLNTYIYGTRYPRPARMAALAKALGVSVNRLLVGPEPLVDMESLPNDPGITDLVCLYVDLTDPQRECVMHVARVFDQGNKRQGGQ